MRFALLHYPFFKLNTRPNSSIRQQFINSGFVSKLMWVMNKNFKRLLTCNSISIPDSTASRIAKQRILGIKYKGFVFPFINSQINMICIKRNWCFSTINSNILTIRCQHMKIASQSYVSLCGRYMFSFYNFLPFTIGNLVFSIKIHPRCHSRYSLHTVCITVP